MDYLHILRYALLFFPFIALLITIPFLLWEYHKNGAISGIRTLFIYSFVFYLLCAYFLVILPLPKISEVAQMTSPRMQLIPFTFVFDFINHSSFRIQNISTYIQAMKESYFYVPLFNIILTLPFGMVLRYFYKMNGKKVCITTFCLSLFFELTQLSGLYFIYPRGYRLFDIDDLMLNTIGGIMGYFLISPVLSFVPGIDQINNSIKERGKYVSGLRRTICFLFDGFLFLFISFIVSSFFLYNPCLQIAICIQYYLIIPLLMQSSTLGEKFLHLRVVDEDGNENYVRLLMRRLFFVIYYFLFPFLSFSFLSFFREYRSFFIIELFSIFFFLFLYLKSIFLFLFTSQPLCYEKWSKTRLISTI